MSEAPDPAALALALAAEAAGSIAGAARMLDLDPSAASRRLAALERQLGVALFERTTRRLRPTEAGRFYLAHARALSREWAALAEETHSLIAGASGRLRVTASAALGALWLMPRLTGFPEAWPNVTLDLIASDAVLDLHAEDLDAALRIGPHVRGEVVAARLADVRYCVVAKPGITSPDTPDDLASQPALLSPLPDHAGPWTFERAGETRIVPLRPVLRTANALALRQAALEGLGVARLADWIVDEDLRAGRLVELCADWRTGPPEPSAIWLVTRSREHRPAKLQAFIDHLRRFP